MSGFTGQAKLELLPDAVDSTGRPLYVLKEDLYFRLGEGVNADCIAIPANRKTNLATFPRGWSPVGRLFWWSLRKFVFHNIADIRGRFIASTVLHDAICSEDYPGHRNPESGYTRFEADGIFRMALESEIPVPVGKMGQRLRQLYILCAYWAVRAAAVWGGKR